MMREDIPGLPNEFEEGTVCPACAAFIGINEVFCPECRAPISLLSNTDPLQRIQAEGFLYGKVVDARPKPVILIGVWVLCLPWALLAVGFGLSFLSEAEGTGIGGFIFFWMWIAFAVIPTVILFKVTRNYFRLLPRNLDEEVD
jgi:hypothetical protein